MTIYEDSRLIRLWRNWLSTQGQFPLDKWLAQALRELASDKRRGGRASEKASPALSLEDQANLTSAMRDGVRFQQLACALEFRYQQSLHPQKLQVDWNAWDADWTTRDLAALSAPAFWYWIQLRVTDVPDKTNTAQLTDAVARHAFFSSLTANQFFAEDVTKLFWLGLRPRWLPLLEQRKVASPWTDKQLQQFLQMQTITPPLWLRINSDQPARDIASQLMSEGVDVHLDGDGRLCARGGRGITGTSCYKHGVIEIQDLASQAIADAVAAKPGDKVWDACAGAGGKTLAIAARMKNKGAIVATDLHDYKLEELKRRVKRAGVFNVRSFTWAGDEPLRLPREIAQQQGFDWVLVDAPCSSSGTWRRNPDARWRFEEQDSQELIELQQKILRNAAQAVRPGRGRLVYATCSWQWSENEAQVDWLVKAHPQLRVESQGMVGAPELDADVMFVAVLAHVIS